jgi:hypothetical protein
MKPEAGAGDETGEPGRLQKFPSLGVSMVPTLECGDELLVLPGAPFGWGDIVLYYRDHQWIAHRVLMRGRNRVITKGDAGWQLDPPIRPGDVWGKVIAFERGRVRTSLTGWRSRLGGLFLSLTSFRTFPALAQGGYRLRLWKSLLNRGSCGDE